MDPVWTVETVTAWEWLNSQYGIAYGATVMPALGVILLLFLQRKEARKDLHEERKANREVLEDITGAISGVGDQLAKQTSAFEKLQMWVELGAKR